MGMDSQHSWCITFTTLIYLALLLQPATGKCVGKWAIHSCFGGAGKRSNPSLTESIENQKQSNLLRQLLLPETYPSNSRLDMNLENEDDESSLREYEDELLERPSADRQRDIDKLNTMLRSLMLQRKIRLAAEGLA